ncbi:hypothetical protein BKA66DRAFT_477377 [Pyrenochaeta sp. MPI-SDFR-AT-0127]|nr:hypothetical protein BKA66DRAFT_477377 [Pyrenochaeta sp. MPI-SDFR-AT-0127]
MSEQPQANQEEPLNNPMPSAGQEVPEPIAATKEPDRMTYKDNEGVEHIIRIPQGQFKQACQHFINNDWDALGQFPQWTADTSEEEHIVGPGQGTRS